MQGGSQSLEVVIIAVLKGKSCWVESECVPTPRHPSRAHLVGSTTGDRHTRNGVSERADGRHGAGGRL